ncbi:MAG TPA: hypothetical protein VGN70_10690 [Gammaproteobacteria bacterium]|jgi:hypothetical protein
MHDLDPNFFLPIWRSVVSYFSHYRPLVQADQHPSVSHGHETASGDKT